MDVHVGTHIRVHLDGVKRVFAIIVVAQRQVHLARDYGVPFFGVEPDIKIRYLKNWD